MVAELVVELVASAVLKLSLPFSKLITLPQISVFMLGLIFTYFALESMVRTIYPCWSNTPSYYSLPFKGEGYIEGGWLLRHGIQVRTLHGGKVTKNKTQIPPIYREYTGGIYGGYGAKKSPDVHCIETL